MGRRLRSDQIGVFPGRRPEQRYAERDAVVARALAARAGLPVPEHRKKFYENLGNRELPVYQKKKAIQTMIRDNPISMIEGPTGSGKSTQVGQYALEMGYSKIVYLVPRILLADNLAARVEQELIAQVGQDGEDLLGVRHSERSNGYGRPIEVMTPDTYLRVFSQLDVLQDQPVLVIGDEIHEKDFPTELAVAVTAQVLAGRPKWRLALMSATLDTSSIQDAYAESGGRPVPSVSVEGRPFELAIVDEPELTPKQAYEKYGGDHLKTQIFTAGKQEIKELSDQLRPIKGKGALRITPLHAKLSRAAIRRATHSTLGPDERQVIPSTNAGQSGITIPGQTLVITDGTIRRKDLDDDGVEGLFKRYSTQDEIIQQGGRAGRDVEGGVLVIARPDDEAFEYRPLGSRDPHAPAQIYHTNISRNVLAVLALGHDFFTLNKRWLISKVEQQRVLDSYDVLYRLGAIDEHNNVTEIGHNMNRFPLRPEFSRSLVAAMSGGADASLLRQIVAMVSAVEAGGFPYFEKDVGEEWRKDIRHTSKDDYTAQLDMFLATRQFYNGEDVNEAELERRNYDLKNTLKAHKAYDKICRAMGIEAGSLPEPPDEQQLAKLHEYLATGLFNFTHRRYGPSAQDRFVTYRNVLDDDDPQKRRRLSDRGTYKANDPLVIGFPRRFEKRVGGVPVEFSTIEHVFPVTQTALSRAALWLAHHVPQSPTVENGQLKQRFTFMFGDLPIGQKTEVATKVSHTPETRKILIRAAYDKQTQALSELIELKGRLEGLTRLVPPDELEQYFPNGTLTQDWLDGVLEQAITNNVDSIYQLDNELRAMMVRKRISLDSWVSKDARDAIRTRSPDQVTLSNTQQYSLAYSLGVPIINGFNLRDAEVLPDKLCLADGREIFINYQIGRDTKRHSAGDVRHYADTLGP